MVTNLEQCITCSQTKDAMSIGLKCSVCDKFIHSKCLQRGAVPGGLAGDVFYDFTCVMCSSNGCEVFVREKLSWLQVVILSLYHLQHQCQGLSRRGYFHWKTHIVAVINKNWTVFFPKHIRPKKNWTGTVAGILSHYNPHFFTSGTSVLNDQGWWCLTYQKLTPHLISEIYTEMLFEKNKYKSANVEVNEIAILKSILERKSYGTDDIIETTTKNMDLILPLSQALTNDRFNSSNLNEQYKSSYPKKNRQLIPKIQIQNTTHLTRVSKKICRLKTKKGNDLTLMNKSARKNAKSVVNHATSSAFTTETGLISTNSPNDVLQMPVQSLGFEHYYNTCMQDLNKISGLSMTTRLIGQMDKRHIISPFSHLSLPPYIWQTNSINPPWLHLMDEVKAKVSFKKNNKIDLDSRSSLDFMYIHTEHIAAINALCAQFFWTGIDVSDALQYPDYTCIVLYKKLVVAFAIVVPHVDLVENYLSFIFTRPGWRNCGIGKYMLYYVVQASCNKDVTLHVSVNNPAVCLYQKYGFKVEHVVLNFYDKFIQNNCKEEKHAFFCRLER